MNATELSNVLSDEINNIRSKKTKAKDANAIANIAGKIIAIARLAYECRGKADAIPALPFFGAPSALPRGTKAVTKRPARR